MLLVACGRGSEPALPEIGDARAVRVAEVRRQAEAERLLLPGTTRSVQRGRLAFPHAGHLAERAVAHGQSVDAGQVLAILRHPALGPQASEAEARVRELSERHRQLRVDAERLENLFARQQVSAGERDRVRSERDAVRESLEQARARLSEARAQLAETELRAPFAGEVAELLVEPGEFVAAGQAVLTLAGSTGLEVEVHLPADRAGRLRVGDAVRVTRLSEGDRQHGEVRQIGRALPGRPAALIVGLPRAAAAGWPSGEAVRVELNWRGAQSLHVPLAAVLDSGGGSRVFRVRDGRAEEVAVDVGRMHAGWVVASGPLTPGDALVVAGHTRLLDGEAVRVLP